MPFLTLAYQRSTPHTPRAHRCRHQCRPFLMQKRHQAQVTRDRRQKTGVITSLPRPFSPRGAAESRFHLIGPGCAGECSLITGEAIRRSCARIRSSRGAKSAIRRFSGFRCGPGKTHTHGVAVRQTAEISVLKTNEQGWKKTILVRFIFDDRLVTSTGTFQWKKPSLKTEWTAS